MNWRTSANEVLYIIVNSFRDVLNERFPLVARAMKVTPSAKAILPEQFIEFDTVLNGVAVTIKANYAFHLTAPIKPYTKRLQFNFAGKTSTKIDDFELLNSLRMQLAECLIAGIVKSTSGYAVICYAPQDFVLTGSITVTGLEKPTMFSAEDPSWQGYFELLPTLAEVEHISNKHKLANAAKLGKFANFVHYFSLGAANEESAIAAELQKLGLKIKNIGNKIEARGQSSTELTAVNNLTTMLAQLAVDHGADYEGWEIV